MVAQQKPHEQATLGGGCFWCLEAVYEQLRGVDKVVSGYAGGKVPDPTYEAVCEGDTGHAEVVQVTFDPKMVSFREVLEVFFSIHDPTTRNRQGADVGTQYRSVVFYHDAAQKATTEGLIHELTQGGHFDDPIVTEVAPLPEVYPAEDYHQGYFRKNPGQGYCRIVIAPKMAKFREKWKAKMKA